MAFDVIRRGKECVHRVLALSVLFSALALGSVLSAQTLNINCGGPSLVGSDGTAWSGDANFVGGALLYTSDVISNTSDVQLYRSGRYNLYYDFSYSIPLPNGAYQLTLKFAEIEYKSVGQRVFDVTINGVKTLANFDIVAAAGGARKAYDKVIPVTVSGGVLKMDFTGIVKRGLVNAIRIKPDTTVAGTGAFLETGGAVSMEAESGTFVQRAASWLESKDLANYSGKGFLLASPNSGVNQSTGYVGVAPEIKFPVKISTPGTYYVWIRGYGATDSDDSVHVGLDGAAVASGETISEFPLNPSAWGWTSYSMDKIRRATIPITKSGVHTIHAWMREDGFRFDKIYLTTDANYVPSGNGPAESLRDTGTAPPPAASPVLQVSPLSLSYSGVAGSSSPSAQSFAISNGGGGTLSWTLAKTQSWLSLSQNSGSGTANVSVSVNTAGLPAGTYTDVVNVAATGATNSPNRVNVSVTISAPTAPPPPPPTSGNSFYTSTSGSGSGDGSISRPWDLQTALNHPSAVRPGDTIWVRGGTYGSGRTIFQSKLVGTSSSPIIVRQYPGERSTINGWLQVGCCDKNPQPSMGAYVWFWGLEFASSITDRTGEASGPPGYGNSYILNAIDTWAPGSRFINNIIHDTRQGISSWTEALNSEAYGNVIYNNGFMATDRGHGHAIYIQNDTGLKKIYDNIMFNQFALGMQVYGSGDNSYVRNFDIQGNMAFNNGLLASATERANNLLVAGGIGGSQGISVKDNYFFNTPEANNGYNSLGFLWSKGNRDVVATGNYFMGGYDAVDIYAWSSVNFTGNRVYSRGATNILMATDGASTSNYTVDRNTYYGAGRFNFNGSGLDFNGWKSTTRFDASSTNNPGAPTGVWVAVRPNRYEPGRANISIYNWDQRSSVAVDISQAIAVGTNFEIRDAQNFYGPVVLRGTYSGGTVNIPMTGLTVAPANGSVPYNPPHTAPQYGVFVLLPK